MATPRSRSNSSTALNAGPSRTLLQQLLEEINGASPPRTARNESMSHSPASTRSWSSYQNHSPSIWIGGSSFARDARNKLRAADQERWRKSAPNTVDGAPEEQTHVLRLDTLALRTQDATPDECAKGSIDSVQRTPDPVRFPYDYLQYMLKGSPLSTTVELSPAAHDHDNGSFFLQAPPLSNDILQPLSPVIFSDVDFEDSPCSPRTEATISPTEVPTSAATTYTAEGPQTPSNGGNMHSSKRIYLSDEASPKASPKKRRTMTLPDIRSEAFNRIIDASHRFIGIGGDNRCILRDEIFTERVPTPRMSVDLSTTGTLPELSSFRPTVVDPQGHTAQKSPSQKLARAFTSPVRSSSPQVPDSPAWMRPMHLVDVSGNSIYLNTHDDGPIRHALCLYCFRTHGNFRKVHKHGYETCGRTEVLDSHYWESESWLEGSSDESTSSVC